VDPEPHAVAGRRRTHRPGLVIGRGRLLADVPITDFIPAGASLEDAYLNLTESAVEYRTEGTGH
jgi:ABC-2 type transport system ATP-binding protein